MRMTSALTQTRDEIETDLAMLGSAQVYLTLVGERVQAALCISSQPGVLAPSLDDLNQAQRLIKKAQSRIAGRAPSPCARAESSESSSQKTHEVHQNMVAAPLGERRHQKTSGQAKRR